MLVVAGGAAAENCLVKPNTSAPAGLRWHYRVDRANNRHCWYVRGQGAKARQLSTPRAELAPQPKSQPLAPLPAARPVPVADEQRTALPDIAVLVGWERPGAVAPLAVVPAYEQPTPATEATRETSPESTIPMGRERKGAVESEPVAADKPDAEQVAAVITSFERATAVRWLASMVTPAPWTITPQSLGALLAAALTLAAVLAPAFFRRRSPRQRFERHLAWGAATAAPNPILTFADPGAIVTIAEETCPTSEERSDLAVVLAAARRAGPDSLPPSTPSDYAGPHASTRPGDVAQPCGPAEPVHPLSDAEAALRQLLREWERVAA